MNIRPPHRRLKYAYGTNSPDSEFPLNKPAPATLSDGYPQGLPASKGFHAMSKATKQSISKKLKLSKAKTDFLSNLTGL